MPSKHVTIWAAIKSYLKLYPSLPMVAYGGESFDPPHTNGIADPYFIVDDLRFDPVRKYQNSSGQNWHTGNLVIGVMCPLEWTDYQKGEYAGRVADYFEQDTAMSYGTVTMRVSRQAAVSNVGYRDGDMFRIPVMVPWEGWA